MSQNNTDFTSGDPSGAVLLDSYLNDFQEDVYTNQMGSSRPSYVVAGMLWIDNTTNPWVVKLFQGTDDIILGNADTSTLKFAQSGATSLSTDLTPQLGGPLDSNGHQVRWSKGADVASASALPILADGNYYDVTGTTSITSINTTGRVGSVIKLHFDAVLTLTHNATDLVLPGGANITTAAGDEAEFIEYASGDFRCTSYNKASGEAVVVTTTGYTLATPQATTSGTSFTFGSVPSSVTQIVINFQEVSVSNTDNIVVTIGDSGGLETTGYTSSSVRVKSGNVTGNASSSASFVIYTNDAGDLVSGRMVLSLLNSSSNLWTSSHALGDDNFVAWFGGGSKALSATLTQVQISGGTFDSGSVNIMYI